MVSLLSLLSHVLAFSILIGSYTSDTDSYVYGGCSPIKYKPGAVYESNVNTLLPSLVNSASSSNFNNFKISVPGSAQSDVVYGLFQCRGDLTNSVCRDCVSLAVSQLGVLCVEASGGALQLEGCFIRYDNVSFLGVEDKTVVTKKCGPSIEYDSETLTRGDALLTYLTTGGEYFRIGGSGNVHGVAQCVQDLGASECQDCLSEAIGRLKNECGTAAWGDMYLAKCYVRYSEDGSGSYSKNGSDEDVEKTLAIIIGLIAGVAVLIFFLSILSKYYEKKGGK